MASWRLTDGQVLDIRVVSFDNLSAGRQLVGGAGWLMGYSITSQAAATAAVVQLIDGTDTSGDVFSTLRIPADTTAVSPRSIPGTPIDRGITLNPLTGPVTGAVTIGRLVS